jgi:hypothetical protein
VTSKPADATWIGPWEQGRRLFDGQSWTIEHTTHNGRPYPATVAVIGTQYDDGRIQSRIVLDVAGDAITTAEARRIIEALTEAVAMADTEATAQNRSRRPTPPGSGSPGEWEARGGPITYSDVG